MLAFRSRPSRMTRRVLAMPLVALLAVTAFLAVPATPVLAEGPVVVPDPARAVPDEYIVTLERNPAVVAAGVEATANRLAAGYHGTVGYLYTAVLFGFSVHMSADDAQRLAADPDVHGVEQDTYVDVAGTQNYPPWGLDRIDQRYLPLDDRYTAPNAAATVNVYVIDTGVLTTHQEFGGRAHVAFNAITGSTTVAPDCTTTYAAGHGTHVAGIVGAKTYGVAKDVTIRSVKVFNCDGRDTAQRVADGVDWVTDHAQRPAVVNMSIGSRGRVPSIDKAVEDSIASGLTYVAAAGNWNTDACTSSPAWVPEVITVGASTKTDQRWVDTSIGQGSNQGRCVDLIAPGENIISTGYRHDSDYDKKSGTSMAAPHVTGVAAMLLAMHPQWTREQLTNAIVGRTTPDVITGFSTSTPNRLLFTGPLNPIDGGALPDGDLNTMWNTYGDQGNHWTGGDTTVSVPLPDGRIAWLFSDTFLGIVNADHSRPPNTPMIHNSIVVQQGNTLTTLTGGTPNKPEALVGPPAAEAPPGDLGYWAYGGTVEGNKLRVIFNHFISSGDGPLAYQQTGTWLATFSLPGITLDSLTDLHIGTTVAWGAEILEDGGYSYVYGIEGAGSLKFLHIARARSGAISGGWEYWTGSGWSTNEAESVRVMSGADGLGVEKIGGSYVMVRHDADGFFSPSIVAYFAESPTGPFADKTQLYTAPEAAPGTGNIVYGPHFHLAAGGPGKLVVSYNVNSLLPDGNTNDAHIYRPRFIDVTLPAPPAPTALPKPPTNLTAVADSQGVHLSWTASPTPGVSYRVYQRDVTDGQTQPVRLPNPVTGTSTSPGLLTNGDTYEFYVTAFNSAGESPGSNTVTVVPQVTPPTAAPTGLQATANDDGTVTLSWTGVAGALWYRIYQKDITNSQADFTELPDQVWASSQVVRGLAHEHTYEFRVAAANTGGEGPPSAPVTVTARIAPPPAPTNLVARSNNDGTISLTWTSQGPFVWFWIYMRDATDGQEREFDRLKYPVITNSFTAGYLTIGHTYEFRVTAINGGGEGPPSNTVSAVARMDLPAPPTNLRAVAGNGTVALSWTAPAPNLWYWVYQRDVTAEETELTHMVYPVTTGTSATAGYLVNGHTYEYYVTAINAGGESAPSNKVTATPKEPLPAAPTGLTATARGDATVHIAWTDPGTDLWYWIYMRDATASEPYTRLQYPLTTGTAFTTGALNLGHTYQFQVSAINSGGEGPRSAAASATVRLDAPTNLTAVATNDGRALLSWRGPGPNLWYWLYERDATAGQPFQKAVYPVTTTHVVRTDLVDGHTYEYKVAAMAPGGEGPASAVAQVTAHGGTPAAPSLSASAGDGRVSLAWSEPEAGAWYWIYRRCVDCGEDHYTRFAYPVTDGTSFVDTAVANGYRYEYRVSAINVHGEGEWSNAVQAKPLPPLPAAPTGLTIHTGDSQAALSWNAPGPNLWYWIYMRDVTAGQSGFTRLKYPVTTNSFTVTLLSDGHTYQFYVTAINVAGESGRSNVVSGTPQPGAPTGLIVTSVLDTSVGLSWQAPNPSNVWYWIYARDVTLGESFHRLPYPNVDTTWYGMYLAHGHTYEFYVTSIKGQGESTRSNIVRATLQVPGGATICSGTVASNYLVNPTGGRPGSGYRYEQRRDMKLETCLIYGPVTTGTTRQVTVRITWNTSGYPLNEGFFWYHLVDYTTGRVVAHQFYGTYDRGATSGSRQTTYTVDSSHYYWAYATGDGSIQLGPPGTLGRTSPFKGWYPPTGIDRLLAGTGYL